MLTAIGSGDRLVGFDAGEFAQRLDTGKFPRCIEPGRAAIERAPEDVWEARLVVDLV